MAGQIPLDPGSMTIAPGGLPAQAPLALAHAQAVAVAAGGDVAAACLGLTVYLAGAAGGRDARQLVLDALAALRRDPLGFVARAERARLAAGGAPGFGAAGGAGGGEGSGSGSEGDGGGGGGHVDGYLQPPRSGAALAPPVVFLEVPALPRG